MLSASLSLVVAVAVFVVVTAVVFASVVMAAIVVIVVTVDAVVVDGCGYLVRLSVSLTELTLLPLPHHIIVIMIIMIDSGR